MSPRRLSAAWPACLLVSMGLFAPLVPQSGAASADAAPDERCVSCHEQAAPLKPGAAPTRLRMNPEDVRGSAHGGLACVDCHSQMRVLPHKPLADAKVDCTRCHTVETQTLALSVHGLAAARNDPDAPGCTACHGTHSVRAIKVRKAEFKREVVSLCLGCHTDERIVARHNLPRSSVIVAYQMSVHGDAVTRGSEKAPMCSDCHGSHGAGPIDGKAPHDPLKVPQLCGGCHKAELEQYRSSVHGTAVAAGDNESPTCTSCHGEHLIQARTDPASSVSRRNIPRTCSSCHEALDIQTKHKLPQKRLETFQTSYHGTLTRLGKTYAAECASCHGYHDILPSSDPASRINRDNLAATCGSCHPADAVAFATLTVHSGLDLQREATPLWQRLLESPWIWLQSVILFSIACGVAALAWRWSGLKKRVR